MNIYIYIYIYITGDTKLKKLDVFFVITLGIHLVLWFCDDGRVQRSFQKVFDEQ